MAPLKRLYNAVIRLITVAVCWLARADDDSFRAQQINTIVSSSFALLAAPFRRLSGRGGPLTSERVRRKYDALAGTYIEQDSSINPGWHVIDEVAEWTTRAALQQRKADFYAEILGRFSPSTVLEVGAGELTTLARLATRLTGIRFLACDLSGARIKVGRQHFVEATGLKVEAIQANAIDLPYKSGSVEVVFTSHCLEHMPLDSRAALSEMGRVASKAVVLFEPCYETAGWIQKLRMRAHGYARGLPQTVHDVTGFRLLASGLVPHGSPFNRTSYLVLITDN